jgi:hypothetical protein
MRAEMLLKAERRLTAGVGAAREPEEGGELLEPYGCELARAVPIQSESR